MASSCSFQTPPIPRLENGTRQSHSDVACLNKSLATNHKTIIVGDLYKAQRSHPFRLVHCSPGAGRVLVKVRSAMCRLNRHRPINHRSAHWKRRALVVQPAQSDMYTLLREARGFRVSIFSNATAAGWPNGLRRMTRTNKGRPPIGFSQITSNNPKNVLK